jgi:hypothetical protein
MTGPMQYEEIEAIVRQGELDEKRKRRQFGLGKLLLWILALALLLGLLRMIGLGPAGLACVAAWIALVTGVRSAFGGPVAFAFSIAVGAIAGAGLALASAHGGWALGAIVPGGFVGWVSYVVLEVVCCVGGVPDGLLRGDDYDRQGPP